MSITDLCARYKRSGQQGDRHVLAEVSVFSHGFFGGPIVVNSDDQRAGSGSRNPNDKDARAGKGLQGAEHDRGAADRVQAAFAHGALWWNWGCRSHRRTGR